MWLTENAKEILCQESLPGDIERVCTTYAKEIMERGAQSQLINDPHVKRVWDLIKGDSLFKMSVDDLASLRQSLRQESLQYFARHNPYYAELFERLDIDPAKATLHDVAKLAIPSDMLREEELYHLPGQTVHLRRGVSALGRYIRPTRASMEVEEEVGHRIYVSYRGIQHLDRSGELSLPPGDCGERHQRSGLHHRQGQAGAGLRAGL